MPRPATPLSVLLLVAFGLLLVAVLSTPIIKAIPLGDYSGSTFGVFGYCNGDDCSGIEIGYNTDAFSDASSFDLPSSARSTLSAILIVHPVAALIVLIYFAMAIVAHFHSAAHSSRYLLCLFLVGLVGFLVSLLAFLVDVLLFVPHLAWGSYLVLAAAILVAISGFVSCMMRRSMAGRKARRNRVQANSEMNGDNFFANTQRTNTAPTASETTMVQQPTVPMLNEANSGDNNLPQFATYESQKKDDRSSDERIPLTARSPSERSPNNAPSDPQGPYGPPSRSNTGGPSPALRDQYGNLIGPPEAYGVRSGRSNERMNSGRGGAPPAGYRGRGGYGPPPGRGGYGLGGYGPPPGRGGYGPRGRGGYGPRGGPYGPRGGGYGPRGGLGPNGMMRGGRAAPPPGAYQGPYDRTPSPGSAYADPYQGQRRSPVPPQSYAPAMVAPAPAYQAYSPTGSELPRAESPPPLPISATGQAVEMDATPSPTVARQQGDDQYNSIRDSDVDVAGMVALQQGEESSSQQGRTLSPPNSRRQHNTMISRSQYSTDDQYLPIRQNWNGTPGPIGEALGSPPGRNNSNQNQPAAELPTNTTPLQSQGSDQTRPPAPESDYYEDVDPRFAEPATTSAGPNPPVSTAMTHPSLAPVPLNIPTASSTPYEELPAGARSPAESERSNFTSISQRGVNPRWNGGPPNPPIMPNQVSRRPVPPRNPAGPDILNSNPDFELHTGGTRRGPGTIPNSAYPTGF
ncbi:pH-response regulator protein palI/RIM9 [Zalerion maritima]|uniref:PH-response regulator protein palI/RIM9 n=1 Tax=Zalerion maritima TaxID=339359 RepID=A0AAD5RV22_9PEZI|nr:pH-response regulator protein palI/RIM9 [Zalerion maritima]